jgi:hypothetical protein
MDNKKQTMFVWKFWDRNWHYVTCGMGATAEEAYQDPYYMVMQPRPALKDLHATCHDEGLC